MKDSNLSGNKVINIHRSFYYAVGVTLIGSNIVEKIKIRSKHVYKHFIS